MDFPPAIYSNRESSVLSISGHTRAWRSWATIGVSILLLATSNVAIKFFKPDSLMLIVNQGQANRYQLLLAIMLMLQAVSCWAIIASVVRLFRGWPPPQPNDRQGQLRS